MVGQPSTAFWAGRHCIFFCCTLTRFQSFGNITFTGESLPTICEDTEGFINQLFDLCLTLSSSWGTQKSSALMHSFWALTPADWTDSFAVCATFCTVAKRSL